MSSNPKTSPHYSATNETRKRKRTNLTLAVETLATLDELSARTGQSRSQVVDDAVLAYVEVCKRADEFEVIICGKTSDQKLFSTIDD